MACPGAWVHEHRIIRSSRLGGAASEGLAKSSAAAAAAQVGSDMAAGEVVLSAGHHIGAAEVGILATVGATKVT